LNGKLKPTLKKKTKNMKCKPITAKAAETTKASPNKYMGALVNDLKGMYKSKGYVDSAGAFGAGVARVSSMSDAFGDKGLQEEHADNKPK